MKSSVHESTSFPIDKENASMMEKILSWFVKLEKFSSRSDPLADFEQIKLSVPKGLVGVMLPVCEDGVVEFDISSIDSGFCNFPRITLSVLTI